MIWRGLQTAFLAGGFVAAGAGVAAAAENDVTTDVAGVTATVPVTDGTVLETPVVTGTGKPLTVTADDSGSAGGLTLPVDTDDDGTTTLGDSGGGISVPVTVTEADGSSPDPQDGLTVTVPVNTSDGNQEAGTTVIVPVVTGNLADVLDQDPTTGNDIDVNLEELIVVTDDDGTGPNVLLDVEDLVTIGGDGSGTTRETVLSLPVSADDGADTTVSLPVADDAFGSDVGGGGTLLAGNDIDVNLGNLITDGSGGSGDGSPTTSDPILSVPVDTGDLGGNGDVLSDNTVDVNLAGLLPLGGVAGGATGSVVTVPVNDGAAGTGGDNRVVVTLPVALPGSPATDDDGTGTGGNADPSRAAGGTTSVAPAEAQGDAPSRLPGTGTSDDAGADTLAYTGTDPLLPVLAGLLTLGAGLVLTRAARRRRAVLE
jgi:hypothetical protein